VDKLTEEEFIEFVGEMMHTGIAASHQEGGGCSVRNTRKHRDARVEKGDSCHVDYSL